MEITRTVLFSYLITSTTATNKKTKMVEHEIFITLFIALFIEY